jgi:Thermostable 8-oxoguanine DNA glycosylase
MYSGFTIEKKNIEEIKKIYRVVQNEIVSRLDEFKEIWKDGSEETIFVELVFCILTPQSRARLCWTAVENLMNKKLLLRSDKNQIIGELKGVRFKYKKAEYIVEARRQFSIDGKIAIKPRIDQFTEVHDAREWLIENVKGIGYKEASHFLRNIGLGGNLAILDRHILKNLNSFGLIDKIPGSFLRESYLEIERKMREFAEKINIPTDQLDLLLWYKEAGEIFK